MSGLTDLVSHAASGFVHNVAQPIGHWAEQVPGAGEQAGKDIGGAAKGAYGGLSAGVAGAQHWLGVPQSQWSYQEGDPASQSQKKGPTAKQTSKVGAEQPAGYGTGLTM